METPFDGVNMNKTILSNIPHSTNITFHISRTQFMKTKQQILTKIILN